MNVLVKQPPELKKRRLTSLQQQLPNFSTGSVGEQRATQFLTAKNFQIVDTNVRFGLHEVDIIACTPENILVFCEVKTRSTSFFGDPSQAVSNKKLKSMQLVAREYLRTAPWTGEYRFDVIAVLPQEIEHFENVTWWS